MSPPRRTWALRIVRVAVTALAIAWVLSRIDLRSVGASLLRVPLWSFGFAIALTLLNLGVGTVRWRLLLDAYGAPRRPTLALLYRLYVVGFFYNVWLPGGVGGDVVRGIASRAAFGERGATGAMAVVLVERVLGLVGMMLLVGAASFLAPIEGLAGLLPASAIALGAGATTVLAIAVGRRLASRLPARLRAVAERLPAIERPRAFAAALLLSLVTHAIVALTGHVFVAAVAPAVPLATSFVFVPLSMSTAYLPITAGGAGAREAAFQALFALVGVSFDDSTAASVLLAATYYLVAALGGLLPIPDTDGASASAPVDRDMR